MSDSGSEQEDSFQDQDEILQDQADTNTASYENDISYEENVQESETNNSNQNITSRTRRTSSRTIKQSNTFHDFDIYDEYENDDPSGDESIDTTPSITVIDETIAPLEAFFHQALIDFITFHCHGTTEMLKGWSTHIIRRPAGPIPSSGFIDIFYLNPKQKKLRSRLEVAVAVGLLPYIRNFSAMSKEMLYYISKENRDKHLASQLLTASDDVCEGARYINGGDSIVFTSAKSHPESDSATSGGYKILHPDIYFAYGNTTVLDWGKIKTDQAFHTSNQLYPVGFRCIRQEYDNQLEKMVDCLCEILEVPSTASTTTPSSHKNTTAMVPMFRITVCWELADGKICPKVYEGSTPKQAWQAVQQEEVGLPRASRSSHYEHTSTPTPTPTAAGSNLAADDNCSITSSKGEMLPSNGQDESDSDAEALAEDDVEGDMEPHDEEEILLRREILSMRKMVARETLIEHQYYQQHLSMSLANNSDNKGAVTPVVPPTMQARSRLGLGAGSAVPDYFNLEYLIDAGIHRLFEGMEGVLGCSRYQFSDCRIKESNKGREGGKKSITRNLSLMMTKMKFIEKIIKKQSLALSSMWSELDRGSQSHAIGGLSNQIKQKRRDEIDARKKARQDQRDTKITKVAQIQQRRLLLKEVEKTIRILKDMVLRECMRKRGEARLRIDVQSDVEEFCIRKYMRDISEQKDLKYRESRLKWRLSRGPLPVPSASSVIPLPNDMFGKLLEIWGILTTYASTLGLVMVPHINILVQAIRCLDGHLRSLQNHEILTNKTIPNNNSNGTNNTTNTTSNVTNVSTTTSTTPSGLSKVSAVSVLDDIGQVLTRIFMTDFNKILGIDVAEPYLGDFRVPINRLTWKEILRMILVAQHYKEVAGWTDADIQAHIKGRGHSTAPDTADRRLLKLLRKRLLFRHEANERRGGGGGLQMVFHSREETTATGTTSTNKTPVVTGFCSGVRVRVPTPKSVVFSTELTWQQTLLLLLDIPDSNIWKTKEIMQYAVIQYQRWLAQLLPCSSNNNNVKVEVQDEWEEAKGNEKKDKMSDSNILLLLQDALNGSYPLPLRLPLQNRSIIINGKAKSFQTTSYYKQSVFDILLQHTDISKRLLVLPALTSGGTVTSDDQLIGLEDAAAADNVSHITRTSDIDGKVEAMEVVSGDAAVPMLTPSVTPPADGLPPAEDSSSNGNSKSNSSSNNNNNGNNNSSESNRSRSNVPGSYAFHLSVAMQRCHDVVCEMITHPQAGLFLNAVEPPPLPASASMMTSASTLLEQGPTGSGLGIGLFDVSAGLLQGVYSNSLTAFYRDVVAILTDSVSFSPETSALGQIGLKLCNVFERVFLERVLTLEDPLGNTNNICAQCRLVDEEFGANRKGVLCDRCDAPFHFNCVQPPLLVAPRGDWLCQHCVSQRSPRHVHPFRSLRVRHPVSGRLGRVIELKRRECTDNDSKSQLTVESPSIVYVVEFPPSEELKFKDTLREVWSGDVARRYAVEDLPVLPSGYTAEDLDLVTGLALGFEGWGYEWSSFFRCFHHHHSGDPLQLNIGLGGAALAKRSAEGGLRVAQLLKLETFSPEDWISTFQTLVWKVMSSASLIEASGKLDEECCATALAVIGSVDDYQDRLICIDSNTKLVIGDTLEVKPFFELPLLPPVSVPVGAMKKPIEIESISKASSKNAKSKSDGVKKEGSSTPTPSNAKEVAGDVLDSSNSVKKEEEVEVDSQDGEVEFEDVTPVLGSDSEEDGEDDDDAAVDALLNASYDSEDDAEWEEEGEGGDENQEGEGKEDKEGTVTESELDADEVGADDDEEDYEWGPRASFDETNDNDNEDEDDDEGEIGSLDEFDDDVAEPVGNTKKGKVAAERMLSDDDWASFAEDDACAMRRDVRNNSLGRNNALTSGRNRDRDDSDMNVSVSNDDNSNRQQTGISMSGDDDEDEGDEEEDEEEDNNENDDDNGGRSRSRSREGEGEGSLSPTNSVSTLSIEADEAEAETDEDIGISLEELLEVSIARGRESVAVAVASCPSTVVEVKVLDDSPALLVDPLEPSELDLECESAQATFQNYETRKLSRRKGAEDALFTKAILDELLEYVKIDDDFTAEDLMIMQQTGQVITATQLVYRTAAPKPMDGLNVSEWYTAFKLKLRDVYPVTDTAAVTASGPVTQSSDAAVVQETVTGGEIQEKETQKSPELPDQSSKEGAFSGLICDFCGLSESSLASQMVCGQTWSEWLLEIDDAAEEKEKLARQCGGGKVPGITTISTSTITPSDSGTKEIIVNYDLPTDNNVRFWLPHDSKLASMETRDSQRMHATFHHGSLCVHECCAENMTKSRLVIFERTRRSDEQRALDTLSGIGRGKTFPIGVDSDGNSYWVFSGCLQSLYVSKKTNIGDSKFLYPSGESVSFEKVERLEPFSVTKKDHVPMNCKAESEDIWLVFEGESQFQLLYDWLDDAHAEEKKLKGMMSRLFPTVSQYSSKSIENRKRLQEYSSTSSTISKLGQQPYADTTSCAPTLTSTSMSTEDSSPPLLSTTESDKSESVTGVAESKEDPVELATTTSTTTTATTNANQDQPLDSTTSSNISLNDKKQMKILRDNQEVEVDEEVEWNLDEEEEEVEVEVVPTFPRVSSRIKKRSYASMLSRNYDNKFDEDAAATVDEDRGDSNSGHSSSFSEEDDDEEDDEDEGTLSDFDFELDRAAFESEKLSISHIRKWNGKRNTFHIGDLILVYNSKLLIQSTTAATATTTAATSDTANDIDQDQREFLWEAQVIDQRETFQIKSNRYQKKKTKRKVMEYKIRLIGWPSCFEDWYNEEYIYVNNKRTVEYKELFRRGYVRNYINRIPLELRSLNACRFLVKPGRNRSLGKGVHITLPDFSACHHSQLDLLRAGLGMVEAALPAGGVDDNEERWGGGFAVIWRAALAAAHNAETLMECMVMLEYGVRTLWLHAFGAKLLTCMPSRVHSVRNATYGLVAMRLWALDMAVRYDKVVLPDEFPTGSNKKGNKGAAGGSKGASKSITEGASKSKNIIKKKK